MTQATINQGIGDDLQFVRERQVLSMFPFSRSQLWKLIREGRFPEPCKLSERVSAWRMSDLIKHGQTLKAKNSDNYEQV